MLYKELLDNEKRNFQLINAAVSDLGGIPAMIQHSDMSNTIPDEKVISQVINIQSCFVSSQHSKFLFVCSLFLGSHYLCVISVFKTYKSF